METAHSSYTTPPIVFKLVISTSLLKPHKLTKWRFVPSAILYTLSLYSVAGARARPAHPLATSRDADRHCFLLNLSADGGVSTAHSFRQPTETERVRAITFRARHVAGARARPAHPLATSRDADCHCFLFNLSADGGVSTTHSLRQPTETERVRAITFRARHVAGARARPAHPLATSRDADCH